jgi:hypothetical protein
LTENSKNKKTLSSVARRFGGFFAPMGFALPESAAPQSTEAGEREEQLRE